LTRIELQNILEPWTSYCETTRMYDVCVCIKIKKYTNQSFDTGLKLYKVALENNYSEFDLPLHNEVTILHVLYVI
jgi:hypothetical protein